MSRASRSGQTPFAVIIPSDSRSLEFFFSYEEWFAGESAGTLRTCETFSTCCTRKSYGLLQSRGLYLTMKVSTLTSSYSSLS